MKMKTGKLYELLAKLDFVQNNTSWRLQTSHINRLIKGDLIPLPTDFMVQTRRYMLDDTNVLITRAAVRVSHRVWARQSTG